MLFPPPLRVQAEQVLSLARERGLTLATAESCTGGLAGAVLTAIPGSSDVFDRAFVTYSNDAKTELLGVPEALITRHGAVSPEVAARMAHGVLQFSSVDLAVAITGVAGPGGGSREKPVGLVFLAAAQREGDSLVRRCQFGDIGRDAVRLAAVSEALNMLTELMR